MVNNKRNFQYAFYVDGQSGNKGGETMKNDMKRIILILAFIMCFGISACGSSDSIAASSEETENAEGDSEELVTDAAFLDGMWSINGGTKLYFDSGGGYYIYRSYMGSADAVRCRSPRKMASR